MLFWKFIDSKADHCVIWRQGWCFWHKQRKTRETEAHHCLIDRLSTKLTDKAAVVAQWVDDEQDENNIKHQFLCEILYDIEAEGGRWGEELNRMLSKHRQEKYEKKRNDEHER